MSLVGAHSPLVTAVGWALISFLWQALLIHGALLLVLRLVPVRRSAARYLVGLVALAALVLAPVATVIRSVSEPVIVPSGLSGMIKVPHPEPASASATGPTDPSPDGLAAGVGSILALDWPVNVQVLMGKVSRYLPLVVLAWLVGAALSVGRLVGDVRAVRRLAREGVRPAPRWLAELVAKQTRSGHRAVPVLVSELVSVPMVLGVLKPLVLVPASVLSGLTPRQLELIIAHELEHVRRFDPVVNQLQCVIEAVFFFHPSVGAINRLVRQEREHRTDAEVARMAGGGRDYATALSQLARVAFVSGPHVAANSGNLSNRVRRVLGAPEQPTAGLGGATGLAVVGLLLVVGAALASPGPGDLAGQIIANPAIIEQLTDEDLDQLLRQTVETGAEEQEKHLELLLLLAERAAGDSILTAMFIVNADLLPPEEREVAREALFAAQREASRHDPAAEPAVVETYEIPHNTEPNYTTREPSPSLILEAGFDLNRAGLAGWGLETLPSGRSLLYVRTHFFRHDGLDRTRLLEDLDMSELDGLPELEPATFGVLLAKFPLALRGANRFSNPDYTLAELLEQDDLTPLEGPWSLWVDDGNVVTRNTSVEFTMDADGSMTTAPTPQQFLCLDDGVVVGGVLAGRFVDSPDDFERIYADCLSGAWGSDWNPAPPSVGQPVPQFMLVNEAGETVESTDLGGAPALFAYLGPIEEAPIVMEVGPRRVSDAPEPAPEVRVEQLRRLIDEAGLDARLVVVAVPYSYGGVNWSSQEVAEALRGRLDVPVFESPGDTVWLDLNLFRLGAGDVMLVDGEGRLVEVFHDFNRLEATAAAFVGVPLRAALARLADAP